MNTANELLILFLGIIGEATALYIFFKKNSKKEIACFIGKHCNEVIRSKHGAFFGIRNEVLGTIYYSLIILWALFFSSNQEYTNVLTVISFFAFSYSAYLTGIQLFVLRKICGLCLLANFSNAIIFAVLFTI